MMFAVATLVLLGAVVGGFENPQFQLPLQALSKGLGDNRISNGKEALLGLFPHQGALSYRNNYACGCSLLSEIYVVTAGTCVDGARPHNLEVTLGITRLAGSREKKQVKSISASYMHPKFEGGGGYNIAILKLESPVVFTDYVKPIRLASNSDNIKPGTRLITSGWGKTSAASEDPNMELMFAAVTVIGLKECRAKYSGDDVVDENVICVRDYSGAPGICKGDAGNPLIVKADDGNFTLVGIASFSPKDGCESNMPGGFTKVQSHLNFIQSIISAWKPKT